MLTRRNLLTMGAATPIAAGLGGGLAVAAEARKRIKITGLPDGLLRMPATEFYRRCDP